MPSDQRKTRQWRLIILLLDVASAREIPFGIPQYLQCIFHGLTSVHFPFGIVVQLLDKMFN